MAHLETSAVKQKNSRQEVWLWLSSSYILSLDSEVSETETNTMSMHTFMNMVTVKTKDLAKGKTWHAGESYFQAAMC